ncbi:MAG: hypothetical protein ABW252_11930 [Polyangiales bacterium]
MSFPDIRELLPHRPPMLWIDEVVAHDEDRIRCRLTVREDHVFVDDGKVEALVAVEWVAQAVGALVGLLDRSQQLMPRPGYLIAVPEAELHVDAFAVGETLDVAVRRAWGDDSLGSFEGEVLRSDVVAVRAKLSVYRPPRDGGGPLAGVPHGATP